MANYYQLVNKRIKYKGEEFNVLRYKPGRKWHAFELSTDTGQLITLKIRFGYEKDIQVIGDVDKAKGSEDLNRLRDIKNKKRDRQFEARNEWYDILTEKAGYSILQVQNAIRAGKLYAYVRTKGYSTPKKYKVAEISQQGFKTALPFNVRNPYRGGRMAANERYINGRFVDHIEIEG